MIPAGSFRDFSMNGIVDDSKDSTGTVKIDKVNYFKDVQQTSAGFVDIKISTDLISFQGGTKPTEPCYVFNLNLQIGSEGADVTALQKLLISKGFAVSDGATGYFGNSTYNALKLYQKAVGLPDTGFLGPLTRDRINNDCKGGNEKSPYISSISSPVAPGDSATVKGQRLNYVNGKTNTSETIKLYIDNVDAKIGFFAYTTNDTLTFKVPTLAVGRHSFFIESSVTGRSNTVYFEVRGSIGTTTPPIATTTPSTIKLEAKNKGMENKSYRVDLSFLGGTASRPVAKWKVNIACDSIITKVSTVPFGDACKEFEIGDFRTISPINNGNVVNKEFWFTNSSATAKKISVTITGYDSSKAVIGIAKTELNIPVTSIAPTPDAFPKVTVTSPNNGQIYTLGQTVPITWKSTNTVGTVAVELTTEDGKKGPFYIKGLPNTGSYNFIATKDYIGSFKARVYVSGVSDDSDKPFSITSETVTQNPITPSITVLSPNGGETYFVGQTVPISVITNLTDKQTSGITFQLYKKVNDSFGKMYAGDIALNWNGGSPYRWTIPAHISSGEYYIYVAGNNLRNTYMKEVIDFSNNSFTITAPTASVSSTPIPTTTTAPIISSTPTPTPTSTVSPATVSLNSTATSITSGSGVTIYWSTSGATSCTSSWSGSVSTGGSVTLYPTSSVTYSLSCINSVGNSTSNSVSISVFTPTPSASVSSTPTPTSTATPTSSATASPSSTSNGSPSSSASADIYRASLWDAIKAAFGF